MKTNSLTAKALYVSVALILTFFNACKKNPLEGVILTLNTDISPAVYSIQVFDANPDNTLTESENFSVKITGKDAANIYTLDGTKNFKFTKGFLTVMVKPGIIPSSNKPLQFSVVVRYRNYLKTTIPVFLTKPEKGMVKVPIINTVNPPKGVTVTNTVVNTNANGSVDNDIKIETPLSADKKETAEVNIPKGTKFFDAAGKEVSGNINVQLVHFDNRNSGSLSAFPGGFTANNVTNASNTSLGNGLFQTAGFVAFEMGTDIQEVESFSQPVQVKIGVNSELKDPTTNKPIQGGDKIPTWSFDSETAQWQQAGDASISYNSTSNSYFADFSTSRRSWYNFDYFFQSCAKETQVELNYTGTENYCKYYIEFENSRFDYFRYIPPTFTDIYDGKIITLPWGLPANESIRIRFVNAYTDEEIGVTPYFASCYGLYSYDVNYQTNNTEFTFSIYGKCPINDRIFRPSGLIYYQAQGSNDWNVLGYMSNGQISTRALEAGKTYSVGTSNAGEFYSTVVTMDGDIESAEVEWILPEDYSGCK